MFLFQIFIHGQFYVLAHTFDTLFYLFKLIEIVSKPSELQISHFILQIDLHTCQMIYNIIIHSSIVYKIAKDWKHPKCSSVEDWLSKLLYIHTKCIQCRRLKKERERGKRKFAFKELV